MPLSSSTAIAVPLPRWGRLINNNLHETSEQSTARREGCTPPVGLIYTDDKIFKILQASFIFF